MSVQDGVMNLTFDYQVKLWLGSDGLEANNFPNQQLFSQP